MNAYENQTLTVDDLQAPVDDEYRDERGSMFTNCVFNETAGGERINRVDFKYATFSGCTWNSALMDCDINAAEGDSVPAPTKVVFGMAPDDGKVITGAPWGCMIKGDGSTTEFDVMLLDQAAIVQGLADAEYAAEDYILTMGKLNYDCGIGDEWDGIDRAGWLAVAQLVLTTDATDTAYCPVANTPDIKGDGASACTITITKKDNAGNTVKDSTTQVDLETSRGKLDALRVTLTNGMATATLASVAETCIATVKATADGVEAGKIDIQFAP